MTFVMQKADGLIGKGIASIILVEMYGHNMYVNVKQIIKQIISMEEIVKNNKCHQRFLFTTT